MDATRKQELATKMMSGTLSDAELIEFTSMMAKEKKARGLTVEKSSGYQNPLKQYAKEHLAMFDGCFSLPELEEFFKLNPKIGADKKPVLDKEGLPVVQTLSEQGKITFVAKAIAIHLMAQNDEGSQVVGAFPALCQFGSTFVRTLSGKESYGASIAITECIRTKVIDMQEELPQEIADLENYVSTETDAEEVVKLTAELAKVKSLLLPMTKVEVFAWFNSDQQF